MRKIDGARIAAIPNTLGAGLDLFGWSRRSVLGAGALRRDVIELGCRAVRLGRSRTMFELAMRRGGEAITRGEVIDVCADAAARKSIGIPAKYRQVIQAWEEAPS